MEQVFLPREAWVLSGSLIGWGEAMVGRLDAVVFVTLEPTERLRRLEARELVRGGGRARDDAAAPDVLVEEVLAWEPS